jgi:hypothetical protein
MNVRTLTFLAALFCAGALAGQSTLVSLNGGGRLRYAPEANGDVIPDFSHCGFMAGAE